MKRHLTRLAALIVAGHTIGGATIVDAAPTVDGHVLLSSHYDFRGAPQNETGVVQPELAIATRLSERGELSLVTWGNLDLSNDTGSAVLPGGSAGHLSEVDFTLAYAHEVGPAALSVGMTSYNFPGGGPATAEVHVEASGAVLGLRSRVAAYRDVDLLHGTYVSGELARSQPLGDTLALELSVALGLTDADHAEGYYGSRDTGLADLGTGLGLTVTRWPAATLGIEVRHATLLDTDTRQALREQGLDPDHTWTGISVARNF